MNTRSIEAWRLANEIWLRLTNTCKQEYNRYVMSACLPEDHYNKIIVEA